MCAWPPFIGVIKKAGSRRIMLVLRHVGLEVMSKGTQALKKRPCLAAARWCSSSTAQTARPSSALPGSHRPTGRPLPRLRKCWPETLKSGLVGLVPNSNGRGPA